MHKVMKNVGVEVFSGFHCAHNSVEACITMCKVVSGERVSGCYPLQMLLLSNSERAKAVAAAVTPNIQRSI